MSTTRRAAARRVRSVPTLFTLFPEYMKKEYERHAAGAREMHIKDLREAYL